MKFYSALTIPQVGTGPTPASGFDELYFKSDDKLYGKSSAAVEVLIGPSSAGVTQAFTEDIITGGNMSVTSTHTDIPGLTRTITSTGTTAVYEVWFAGWVIAGATTHTVAVECLADGNLQTGAAIQSGLTGGVSIAFPWRVTGLASGSRIIKLRAYTSVAGQTGTIVGSPNSKMTIKRTD